MTLYPRSRKEVEEEVRGIRRVARKINRSRKSALAWLRKNGFVKK